MTRVDPQGVSSSRARRVRVAGLFLAAVTSGCGAAPPAALSGVGVSGAAPASPAPPAAGSAGAALGAGATREERVEDVQLVTGELKSIRSYQFATPRSEAWELQIKWLAEDGSSVKEGERVIEFDNTAITQGREEKKLRLVQARIDLESREAALAAERVEKKFALESARSELEKARLEAAVPVELREKRDWQEKQSALRKAEAAEEKARLALEAFEVGATSDLEVLRIARDKATRDVESVERDLSALTLTAPRGGIFAVQDHPWEGRKLQVGDTVWPGMELASIPDLSEMEVVGTLPEVDEGRIGAGQPVRCVLDTYPDRVFKGHLVEVSPIGKEANQRTVGGFQFRAKLEESDARLMRPGMSVRMEVVRRVWQNVLTVPRQNVVMDGEKSWLVGPSGERVAVRLAACTPTRCVVEGDAGGGERVAVR